MRSCAVISLSLMAAVSASAQASSVRVGTPPAAAVRVGAPAAGAVRTASPALAVRAAPLTVEQRLRALEEQVERMSRQLSKCTHHVHKLRFGHATPGNITSPHGSWKRVLVPFVQPERSADLGTTGTPVP
jgi:hypothetical protein